MIIKKYILAIILIGGLCPVRSFGQSQQFYVDSSKNVPLKITFTEFDRRIDKAIKLLQTEELSKIPDSEHVNIMMCLNTIFLNNLDEKFNSVKCKRLTSISNTKDYIRNIDKVYPDWLFNRGMGHYYPKIKMELYGTPNLYATFVVQ